MNRNRDRPAPGRLAAVGPDFLTLALPIGLHSRAAGVSLMGATATAAFGDRLHLPVRNSC